MKRLILLLIFVGLVFPCYAKEKWKVTFYCSCSKCCNKYADNYFASGKKVYKGGCANNWLKFGTKVKIKDLGIYTVEDRGSIKYFGKKEEKRKCIDIYVSSHQEAKEGGIKYLEVKVLNNW